MPKYNLRATPKYVALLYYAPRYTILRYAYDLATLLLIFVLTPHPKSLLAQVR